MIRRATNRRPRRQAPAWVGRVFLVLAVFALAFRIVAPPGTMVAGAGHGVALVICTGHGPMAAVDTPAKAPASKSRSDGSCEFAAQASHTMATAAPAISTTATVSTEAMPVPARLARIGQGLAAPPPPSHAPPALYS